MRLIDYDEAYAKAHDLVHRGKLEWEEFSDIINFLDSMQIIDAEAVQRWIPVEERLPEKGGYYLVHHKHGLILQRLYYEGQGELFVNVKHDPVTHWMPLPDAPMEDSNA